MKADKPLGSIVINLELYYNTEEPLTLLIFLSKFKHIVRTRSFFFLQHQLEKKPGELIASLQTDDESFAQIWSLIASNKR